MESHNIAALINHFIIIKMNRKRHSVGSKSEFAIDKSIEIKQHLPKHFATKETDELQYRGVKMPTLWMLVYQSDV